MSPKGSSGVPSPTISPTTQTLCVDPREIKHRREQFTFVDVRTPGEFESTHIPSARNLPLDELDQHVDRVRTALDEGEDVVLVCRAGSRAHQAQETLAAAGLPELPILEGGMLAWEQAQGDVVVDVVRWDLERQVRFVAGLIVVASILASLVWPPARFVAAGLGAGLVFASVTNTCAMGMLLAKLPYNRPRSATSA
jgi:rhodanese-related sulfurtransferase